MTRNNINAGVTNLLHYVTKSIEIYLVFYIVLFSGYRYQIARPDVNLILFIILAILAAAWAAAVIVKKIPLSFPARPDIYIIFSLSVITSIVHSVNVALSISEVMNWFISGFIFLAVYNLIENGYSRRSIINTTLLLATSYNLLKTYQVIEGFVIRTTNCGGLVNNPNVSSAFINITMMVGLSEMIRRKGKGKIWPGILFVTSILLTLLSGSRGGMIAGAAALFMYLVYSEWIGNTKILTVRSKAVPVIAGLILLPIMATAYLRPNICVNRITGEETLSGSWSSNISYRGDIAKTAIQLFADNPALGIGPGTFYYVAGPEYNGSYLALHAHNLYLHIAAERGMVGFAASGLLVIVLLSEIILKERDLSLAAAGVGVLVSIAAHGLVDVTWVSSPYIMRYAALVLALVMAGPLGEKEHAEIY